MIYILWHHFDPCSWLQLVGKRLGGGGDGQFQIANEKKEKYSFAQLESL